ncbi:MAG TPA: glycosidase [Candidatus Hydrogenedentes bacterium]|nr:glycosidase [Candidatus Hydrogenedentota bacterium]HIJ73840.1 glycosidase [Candidatus Hydrogenedentota bacterium]
MLFKIGRDIFHRWEGNPALTLADIPFRCNTVFNGTPVKRGDEYLLLLRIEGQQGYSFFALAKSRDGFRFDVEEKPVLLPARDGVWGRYESQGIEDPRATCIDGTYYIMYTATGDYGHRIALAKTDDFHAFERVALISEPGNKDGVLFPEKINGQYVRLDRPIGLGTGSIWISYSNDLYSWGDSKVLISPRSGYWDSYRIGASAPPIRTKEGWLEIYHGVKMTSAGPVYRAGTVLLDLEAPSKVVARCSVPLLSPREDYERVGDVGNVVFACGAIVEPTGEVKMYYGAADTCVCVATAPLQEVVDCTLNHNSQN